MLAACMQSESKRELKFDVYLTITTLAQLKLSLFSKRSAWTPQMNGSGWVRVRVRVRARDGVRWSAVICGVQADPFKSRLKTELFTASWCDTWLRHHNTALMIRCVLRLTLWRYTNVFLHYITTATARTGVILSIYYRATLA